LFPEIKTRAEEALEGPLALRGTAGPSPAVLQANTRNSSESG